MFHSLNAIFRFFYFRETNKLNPQCYSIVFFILHNVSLLNIVGNLWLITFRYSLHVTHSHELFMSNFKTFRLFPTHCFSANQITALLKGNWIYLQIKMRVEERVTITHGLTAMKSMLTCQIASFIISSGCLIRKC